MNVFIVDRYMFIFIIIKYLSVDFGTCYVKIFNALVTCYRAYYQYLNKFKYIVGSML